MTYEYKRSGFFNLRPVQTYGTCEETDKLQKKKLEKHQEEIAECERLITHYKTTLANPKLNTERRERLLSFLDSETGKLARLRKACEAFIQSEEASAAAPSSS